MRPVSTLYTLTAAATLLFLYNTVAQAFEPTWLPGGDDVKAAVAARQDGRPESLDRDPLAYAAGSDCALPLRGGRSQRHARRACLATAQRQGRRAWRTVKAAIGVGALSI